MWEKIEMLDFKYCIKPFISSDTCGDSAFFSKCKDSYLLFIGDLGGHSNKELSIISSEIKKSLEKNKEKNIYELFELINNLNGVKEYGLAFFLGRVNEKIEILQYIAIGNIKLNLLRKKNIKNLKKQDGFLGFQIPENIENNLLKLKNNDKILICTDGVDSFKDKIISFLSLHSLEESVKYISDKYSLKKDDALVSILEFKQKETFNNIEIPTFKREEIHFNTISETAYENHVNTEVSLKELDKSYFFSSIDNSLNSREKLSQILNYLNFDSLKYVKVKTIILEVLSLSTNKFDIYISTEVLQIKTLIKEVFVKKLTPIIGLEKHFLDKEKNLLIINYPLSNKIETNSSKHNKLKEMINLGLDKNSYKMYKIDEEKNRLLTKQSKLAALGEMIGAIAHQWRQPLNELAIRIQKIKYAHKNNKINDSYIKEFLKENMMTIEFMSNTIDDFRNFFKNEKQKSVFNVRTAIEHVIDIQTCQLNEHNIKITIEGDDFDIYGLKNEFMQVILNLINNSKDAFFKNKIINPMIKIDIRENKISLEDNAGGINKKDISRVFEPYFTTKNTDENTGIGLYMSKIIIEDNMNGELKIENKNNGIEITILLGDIQ